jgi:hypothetical protein
MNLPVLMCGAGERARGPGRHGLPAGGLRRALVVNNWQLRGSGVQSFTTMFMGASERHPHSRKPVIVGGCTVHDLLSTSSPVVIAKVVHNTRRRHLCRMGVPPSDVCSPVRPPGYPGDHRRGPQRAPGSSQDQAVHGVSPHSHMM